MKSSKIMLGVVVVGLLTSIGIAQQNQDDQQKRSDPNKSQQRYNAQDQKSGQSRIHESATPSAETWNKPMHAVRASKLMGKELQNAQGKDIGDINDLLIDLPQGRIAGVVIGVGGILGIGEKDRVVPPQIIEGKGHKDYSSSDRSKDATDSQVRDRAENRDNQADDSVFVVKMDENLRTTKTSEQDLQSYQQLDQVYRDYQQSPYWSESGDAGRQPVRQQDRTASANTTSFQVKKAKELMGSEVKGQANKNVGELKDFVVDLQSGRILYATLSVVGTPGIGERVVAVPPRQFAMHSDGNLMLNTTEERLKNAPKLNMNQSELSDPAWVSKLYNHYGETSDWSADPITSKTYQNKHSLEKDQRAVREEKQNDNR